MNLTRYLLLAIATSLVACTVVWMACCEPMPSSQMRFYRKIYRDERIEIVNILVGHVANGKPLTLTNPDRYLSGNTTGEPTRSILIQVPDEYLARNFLTEARIEFRSHTQAMTGLFSRSPDWTIRFDDDRHERGAWRVHLASVDGPTKYLHTFEFRKQGRTWRVTHESTAIGCG